jgi:hypothetical protein
LKETQRIDVYQRLGGARMNLGRYLAAAEAFRHCYSWAKEQKVASSLMTTFGFNYAEALRRADKKEHSVLWKQIVEGLKSPSFFAERSLPIQANRWQAAHIASALTSDVSGAQDCLEKAHRAAKAVGEAEDIFTVKTYEEVSVQKFLEINQEMADALRGGKLWDGTEVKFERGKSDQ